MEVIEFYKFPVHIITKSNLVCRDFDILKSINDNAILPIDLQSKLTGTLLTFSFSMLEDDIANIFEPGATPPGLRLLALKSAIDNGFKTGVSLMPMLPYITDNGYQLERIFSTFGKLKIDYILPATLTLFGHGPSDSRTLVFRAVKKHYPHLLEKYEALFGQSDELPRYYQAAFDKKTTELCIKNGLKKSIL